MSYIKIYKCTQQKLLCFKGLHLTWTIILLAEMLDMFKLIYRYM